MLETLTNLVGAHPYLALFGILFISAMGVPIPEEPVLLAGGLAVGWGKGDWLPAMLAGVSGVLAGDCYIYCLGRFFGDRFLRTALGRWVFPPKRHARIHRFYARHGNKTVFLGRFIPAVRFGVFFFAGQLRLSPLRFVGLNLAGAILNIPVSMGIGIFAARTFLQEEKAREFAQRLLHEYQFWFFLVLGLVIAGLAGWAWWKRSRGAEAEVPAKPCSG